MGSGIGTIASWSITGYMVDTYGWPSAFYMMGGIMALFTVSWYFLVYDSPADHPRIRTEERKFIEDSLNHCSNVKRVSSI